MSPLDTPAFPATPNNVNDTPDPAGPTVTGPPATAGSATATPDTVGANAPPAMLRNVVSIFCQEPSPARTFTGDPDN